jgi:hypothetical protein
MSEKAKKTAGAANNLNKRTKNVDEEWSRE